MRQLLFFAFISVISCRPLDKKLASFNKDLERHLKKAEEFKNQKKWKNAIRQYDQLIKVIPDNTDLYFQRGYAKEMALMYAECISDFTKVIELDPKKDLARTNRGFAYKKLGEYERALDDFTSEIKVNFNPYSFEHRASIRYILKQYDSASVDVNKSIELDPDNSIAYRTRAMILFALNKVYDGCSDVKRAKELGIEKKYPEYKKEISELELRCK
jgi:tetratricopeptide (TPR) repeat protein